MPKPLPHRALAITEVSIDTLIPYANNSRKHSKSQIGKIAASLTAHGWINPLITDDRGNVVCGHGRLLAARRLGMTTVPVIALANMSEADRRAYIIADNAIAEHASWSKKTLAAELQGLVDIGYDVELTGFDTIEIDTLLGYDPTEADPAERVELPNGSPAVTRLGDLWQIGRHRLLCGDAREQASYDRLFAGELAQMIFTDPPYNCPIAGNVSGLGQHKHGNFVMGSGEMSDAEFMLKLLRPTFRAIANNAAPGAIAFVCIDWRRAPQLLDASDGVFAELKNMIVWAKTNASMGTFYRSQHELIYAFKVTKGAHINNFGLGEGGRHRSNIWTYAGANTFRRGRAADLADHATVKPRKLVADAILDCSRPGGIILDSFAGSGTTLVAAEITGRNGRGIELEPKFCDVVIRRVEEATGEIARLDSGESFTDVKAARDL